MALHKTHSALLLLGAQSLQQLPNFSIVLHALTVAVAEELLQHLLLVLETQAQLLCHLALPGAQLAQQSCCKLLSKGEERREILEIIQGLSSLGVAEGAVSAGTGMFKFQKQPPPNAEDSFRGGRQQPWFGTAPPMDKLAEGSGSQAKALPPLPCSCHAGRSAAVG